MGSFPSRWRALVAGLAATVGLGAGAEAETPLAPREAPAAWIAYAERATSAVALWLAEDNEPASRLRGYLLAGPEAKAVALQVKVWVTPEGVVSRVDYAPLGDAEAERDLTAALVGRELTPPPPRMIQPLRLAIEVRTRDAQP
jgi:hypothetical protein